MAKKTPGLYGQFEGSVVRIYRPNENCSKCFKAIEFGSTAVFFCTSTTCYLTHPECEAEMRLKIEIARQKNIEYEQKEQEEIGLLKEKYKREKKKIRTKLRVLQEEDGGIVCSPSGLSY